MVLIGKSLLRIFISLSILWIDHNFLSKILFFNLRLSFLLLFLILLYNFEDLNITDWYLPIFIVGIFNDLILPSSFIGLTSLALVSTMVVVGKFQDQKYFSNISSFLFGNMTFYILSGFSILFVSGVSPTWLLIGTISLNILKLVTLNIVFQLIVLSIFNFGRNNV